MSEKIYPLLNWLDISQAVDWLQGLTESAVTQHDLISLCAAKQCHVYVELGQSVCGTDEETWWQDVSGCGIQEVKNPSELAHAGMLADSRLVLFGEATWTDDKGKFFREKIEWTASVLMIGIFPMFRPADIRALAQKMNGSADQSTVAEVEDLRRQLIEVSEAKENACLSTERYKTQLEAVCAVLEREKASLKDALSRAKEAEKNVSDLLRQLDRVKASTDHYQEALSACRTEVAELNAVVVSERESRKYTEKLVSELRVELEEEYVARMAEGQEALERSESFRCSCELDGPTGITRTDTGITFPYATKQLEAMRDAALAHWALHDRSKPAPYGIQKTVAGFLADRTGHNARKLSELAAAIKPDGLPKG